MDCEQAAAAALAAEQGRGVSALRQSWVEGGFQRWLRQVQRDLGSTGPLRTFSTTDHQAIAWPESNYPSGLRRLASPPPVVFVRGRTASLSTDVRRVAVVGSRRASLAGRSFAFDLARGLAAAGVAVVSGLALGIDGEAHRGALAGQGATIAVLPSAIDRPVPQRHGRLAEHIVTQGGLLLSERPPGAAVAPWQFPRRNRLVAALSDLVVVVEAARRSGTLTTVGHAQRLGVEVAAVPGVPGAPGTVGSNGVLRAGAHLIESADDVLALLRLCGGADLAVRSSGTGVCVDLTPDERSVLTSPIQRVASTASWVDASGLPPVSARAALASLLTKGRLRRLPGGRLGRVI